MSESKRTRKYKQIRILSVFSVLGLCLIAILVRMYQLQVRDQDKLSKFAKRQYMRKVELPRGRGTIYDRHMNEVALSAKVESVFANPKALENPERAAYQISRILNLPLNRLRRILATDRNFVWIKRMVPPQESEKIRKLNLPGVDFLKENKRYYPKLEMAAQVVGFCGIDNQGLNGVEFQYDSMIRGEARSTTIIRDALGRWIDLPVQVDPEDTQNIDLVLTLDLVIQHFAEEALEKKFSETRAEKAIAIVMQPWTGEILALAERPGYDPNRFSKFPKSTWKSLSATQSFEPGSTFKTFLVAAALEEKAVTPDTLIDCQMGEYKIGGKVFREAKHRRFGEMPVSQVVVESSNIGAIKIGEMLGGEKYYQYIRRFGFGSRTGIDLPGETGGLLRKPSRWSALSLPSLSFGQEILATPIQMVTAMSAIANGGYLMKAHLVKNFTKNGRILRTFRPEVSHRVVSAETCKIMTGILRQVVDSGTGKKAQISGLAVAGKTGTAQKIDPATGTYSPDKYVSSFLGFFPADYPMFTLLVIVDEPKGDSYGGLVAAPVFREIAQRIARYVRIPTQNTEVYEMDWREFQPVPSEGNKPDPILTREEEPQPGFTEGLRKWVDDGIRGIGYTPPATDPDKGGIHD